MVSVERYRKTRFWAVYEYGELLCVTVYKKGANAVKSRLEEARIPAAPTEQARAVPLTN
jgi:hypothetical protein